MAPSRTCTSPFGRSPILSSIDRTCAPRTTNSPRAGNEAGADCASASRGKIAAAVSAVVAVKSVRRSILFWRMMFSPGT
jgi:hypothetical protein